MTNLCSLACHITDTDTDRIVRNESGDGLGAQEVAGSTTGRGVAAQRLWENCSHPCTPLTKRYNLVPVNRWWRSENWEGNRRSGIALAMRYWLQWCTTSGITVQGILKEVMGGFSWNLGNMYRQWISEEVTKILKVRVRVWATTQRTCARRQQQMAL